MNSSAPRQTIERCNRVFFVGVPSHYQDWSKQVIDSSFRPEWMSEIASCVRNAFLVSNEMRRNVRLYLIPLNTTEPKTIMLDGAKLRYLEPSERTTLLLLSKAYNLTPKEEVAITSTPGIFIRSWCLKDVLDAERCSHLLKMTTQPESSASALRLCLSMLTSEDKIGFTVALENEEYNSTAVSLCEHSLPKMIPPPTIILIINTELDRAYLP